jgi:deoxycytidylate deaminase
MNCAKLVANSGVARVVVRLSEIDSHADIESPIELLKSCGLQVEIMRKEN